MAEAEIRPVRPLPSSGGEEPPLTVLSEADFLKGHLEMRDGHLLGSFEGEIECGGELLVGPDAKVAANVRAVHVTISGMVSGNIQAGSRSPRPDGSRVKRRLLRWSSRKVASTTGR